MAGDSTTASPTTYELHDGVFRGAQPTVDKGLGVLAGERIKTIVDLRAESEAQPTRAEEKTVVEGLRMSIRVGAASRYGCADDRAGCSGTRLSAERQQGEPRLRALPERC